jgi:short-subunit dehydrogenase
VRVTALCPGPVETEFQARAGMTRALQPRILNRSAGRVAEDGYRALKEGRRVVVPGTANWIVTSLVRFVPHDILLKMTAMRQEGR